MLIGLRVGALKSFREGLGWTQRDLAEQAGISRATVNRIERGHAESVTFGTINALARALGRDADMLVAFARDPDE